MDKLKKFLENKELVAICAFAVCALAVLLIGILALKTPVVAMAFLIIIETAIAVSFHRAEVWMHGIVLVIELVAGIIVGRVAIMILCMILYVVATIALQFLNVSKFTQAAKNE